MNNYYQILGIDKNATQEDIKKAYKKRARETHPDVGGKEEDFKLVNEAYSILSDQQKRKQYDNPNPFANGNPFGGVEFDFADIFEQFGSFNFGKGFNPFARQDEYYEELDINVEVKVSFKSVYQDKKVDISFYRNNPCGKCDGTGVQESDDSDICLHCDGAGQVKKNNGYIKCQFCHGSGKIHTQKCSTCNGNKVSSKHETTSIDNIFVLGEEPQRLSYRGYGHYSKFYQGRRGNLNITLIPEQDRRYTKIGNNLIYDLEVDYRTAINGGEIEYLHLDDKTYKIKIPPKSNKGSKFKLAGKGLLNRDKQSRGDLIINLSIIIDYSIEDKKKKK